MGWSVGFDPNHKRDIGYGVPAVCDHPECDEMIDRGLGYVCGDDVYGGEWGCGLFFCEKHRGNHEDLAPGVWAPVCERCAEGKPHFEPKPDTTQWIHWKLTDPSWADWRAENPDFVAQHTKRKRSA